MPLPYVSYFPDPTRIHRPDRMLYSDHKSLNSMGPTPTLTRTLGMRLSCKNVYTTVYHVQYTYTCTRAHPQRTSSRGKVRVGQKSADMSSRRAERARADFRVGVGVRVRVGPVEFKLIASLATMTASLGVTCVRADS